MDDGEGSVMMGRLSGREAPHFVRVGDRSQGPDSRGEAGRGGVEPSATEVLSWENYSTANPLELETQRARGEPPP